MAWRNTRGWNQRVNTIEKLLATRRQRHINELAAQFICKVAVSRIGCVISKHYFVTSRNQGPRRCCTCPSKTKDSNTIHVSVSQMHQQCW
jgi:hypothetical protein